MRCSRIRLVLLPKWSLFGAILALTLAPFAASAGMYRSFANDIDLFPLPSLEKYSGRITLKFVNGSDVTLSGNTFGTSRKELEVYLDDVNRSLQIARTAASRPLFSRPATALKAEREQAELREQEELPDLALFFSIDIAEYKGAIDALIALRSNPAVEIAYANPRPVPPPTPNLIPYQGYLQPATANGYDAEFAWTQTGGDGSQIQLIDAEYDWAVYHEDLQKSPADIIWGTRYTGYGSDHGTASIGVSCARNNSYGMRGIVYNATLKLIGVCDAGYNWVLADAINNAVANSHPGDVILLEQQGWSDADTNYCPVEIYPDVYSAIVNATANGRIIIEPAGNGYLNLDAPSWGGIFNRAVRDSKAIMVGAGTAAYRDRCDFSCYGSRLDIQGWGDWTVASTGYGDLHGTALSNRYTATFAGTSSGSALSAGIAASVQSYAKGRWHKYLSPLALRSNLVENGYAQTFGLAGHIGPLPNLRNSYQAVDMLLATAGINDYNGDKGSDLCVLDVTNFKWYALPLSGTGGFSGIAWGSSETIPVCGDYDGDRSADLAVFNSSSGRWFIRTKKGTVLAWNFNWGWSGVTPVAGDYDGDGKSDLAVFDETTGRWFIWSLAKKKTLLWNMAWGGKGATPTSGDYDGDGISDLALRYESTSRWFAYSVAKKKAVIWNASWGWNGCAYVPGDFDSDGADDLAAFDTSTGRWFIYSAKKNKLLAWNQSWGFYGVIPVSGDYDGDGKTDLAVYYWLTGKWYIRTLAGKTLAWGTAWGWSGAMPVML